LPKKNQTKGALLLPSVKLLFVIFGIYLLLAPQTSIAAGQEIGIKYKHSIDKITIVTAVDFRQQNEHLFRKHFDLGLRSSIPYLDKSWLVSAHYRYVYTPANQGGWNLEERPYLQLQKKFASPAILFIPTLNWKIRNRQEFRFRQQKNDSKRHRLKVTVKSKNSFLNSHPFVAKEYYYDFLKDEITKSSFELGFQFPKINNIKTKLYYKYTSTYKKGHWQPYSAVVLKLFF